MMVGSLALGALRRLSAALRLSASSSLQQNRVPGGIALHARLSGAPGRGSDAVFYDEPRFITHIDDGAIGALRDYYAQNFTVDVLDICSSWISHLPDGLELGRVAGLG